MELPDDSGFMVVEIEPDGPHPLKQKATYCLSKLQDGSTCLARAVFFNPGNVDVSCHHCGSSELDIKTRQYHLAVWLEAKPAEDES